MPAALTTPGAAAVLYLTDLYLTGGAVLPLFSIGDFPPPNRSADRVAGLLSAAAAVYTPAS